MKKQLLLLATLGLVSSASVQAQGYFNFANYAAGVTAPVTFGGVGIGQGYLADAYWGPAGTTSEGALTSLGLAVAFAGSGYFAGGSTVIPGQTAAVTLQVVAWKASDGATFAAALANPNGTTGRGNLIQLVLGVSPGPTPNMVGLTPFSVVGAIPEPSTLALLGLGTGALLFLRRRK